MWIKSNFSNGAYYNLKNTDTVYYTFLENKRIPVSEFKLSDSITGYLIILKDSEGYHHMGFIKQKLKQWKS